jgi:hypothetical protein
MKTTSRTAHCRRCLRRHRVLHNGTVGRHYRRGGGVCPGAGRLPSSSAQPSERTVHGQRELLRRDGIWVCGELVDGGRLCGYTTDRHRPCRHLVAAVLVLPIPDRVVRLRHWRGLSQPELAYAVDRTKSWMDKVERGMRGLDKVSVIERIAEALAVDPALLLLPSTSTWTAGQYATAGGAR